MPLPSLPSTIVWSGNIQTAYQSIQSVYNHAEQLAALEDAEDPIRLQLTISKLNDQAGILDAIQKGGVPHDWIIDVALQLGLLREKLKQMVLGAQS
jgi:hypothetical protein